MGDGVKDIEVVHTSMHWEPLVDSDVKKDYAMYGGEFALSVP